MPCSTWTTKSPAARLRRSSTKARPLPAEVCALADAVVRVPIHGAAESLNLAAAAAVCLYASARALRRQPDAAAGEWS